MKKSFLKKAGWISTAVSIITGIVNILISVFKKSVIGSVEGVEQSLPWAQTLLIMSGVFVVVFVVLIVYYFVLKKKVEEIPRSE